MNAYTNLDAPKALASVASMNDSLNDLAAKLDSVCVRADRVLNVVRGSRPEKSEAEPQPVGMEGTLARAHRTVALLGNQVDELSQRIGVPQAEAR